jgi:hypothetical protein
MWPKSTRHSPTRPTQVLGPVSLKSVSFVKRLDTMMIQAQEPQIPRRVGPAVCVRNDVIHVKQMARPHLVTDATLCNTAAVKKQGA